MMRQPRQRERYPIIHCHIESLGYYWEHVKIRSADYFAYLKQTDMELQLLDGTAEDELLRVYKSIKRRGLINPLVVTPRQGRLYVVVGCQRLAVLRVLQHQGEEIEEWLPCRLAEEFDEEVVLQFHPQKAWGRT